MSCRLDSHAEEGKLEADMRLLRQLAIVAIKVLIFFTLKKKKKKKGK